MAESFYSTSSCVKYELLHSHALLEGQQFIYLFIYLFILFPFNLDINHHTKNMSPHSNDSLDLHLMISFIKMVIVNTTFLKPILY